MGYRLFRRPQVSLSVVVVVVVVDCVGLGIAGLGDCGCEGL